MKLNHIKDSFENRRIEPSANAWDQLAGRLDQEEKKSKKPVIYWLSAVAAVLVFAILLYPVFTNDIETIDLQNEIVVDDTQNESPSPTFKQQVKVITTDLNEVTSLSSEEAVVSAPNKQKKNPIALQNKKLETVTSREKIDLNTSITKNDKSSSTNTLIEDNSLNPEFLNSTAQAAPKKLTAEEEMELLLNEAFNHEAAASMAVEEIKINQLIRETEWDIEADRRNIINSTIFDQLDKLKTEAVALIDRKK